MGFLDGEMSRGLKTALEREGHQVLLGDAVLGIERIPGGPLHVALKSRQAARGRQGPVLGGARRQHRGARARARRREARRARAASWSTSTSRPRRRGSTPPATSSATPRSRRCRWSRAASPCATPSASPTRPRSRRCCRSASTPSPRSRWSAPPRTSYARAAPTTRSGAPRYHDNARGQIIGEPDGAMKLLFDPRHAEAAGRAHHRRPRDRAGAHRPDGHGAQAAASTSSSTASSTSRRCRRSTSTPPTTASDGSRSARAGHRRSGHRRPEAVRRGSECSSRSSCGCWGSGADGEGKSPRSATRR